MEGTQNAAAGLTEALRESLAPVRSHLATVEAAIVEKEAELAELRAVRTVAQRIIRATDPEGAPPPTRGRTRNATGKQVSRETLDTLRDELRARFTTEDDLWAALLAKDDGLMRAIGGGRSYGADTQRLSKAMPVLRDEGVLRLDRLGIGKANNAKVYRLTTGGDTNGRP